MTKIRRLAAQSVEKRHVKSTRFLLELLTQFRQFSAFPDPRYRVYTLLTELLEDPNTKRMVFDARQATLFDAIGDMDPAMRAKVHPPFNQLYVEFSEPILLGESEPGHEDYARGFYFAHEVASASYKTAAGEALSSPLSQVTFFLTEQVGEGERGKQYIDRSFKMNLSSGYALVRKKDAVTGTDPSEVPEDWTPGSYFLAAQQEVPWSGTNDRHIGWWERVTDHYASLVLWVFAYTMAKSIHVVQEPMSRQYRRWMERKNKLPHIWHYVRVEPKFITHAKSGEEPAYHQSYRYDVIGHLRFGKHPRADGSFSETIEWVQPHQRGLEHSLYIPKTYGVESKKVHPRMARYFAPVDR